MLVWRRELVKIRNGAIWIMVGRRRKAGKRESNGRIARAYEDPKAFVAAQPHRAGVMKKLRELPEAGSEFGKLLLTRKITPAQHEAGLQYAGLAEAARRIYSPLPLHPTGIDLNRVSGGGYDGDMPREQAQAIKDRHNKAFEACSSVGARAARAVKDHAIMDMPVRDSGSLALLINGLDALVVHFGIDRRARISSRQK